MLAKDVLKTVPFFSVITDEILEKMIEMGKHVSARSRQIVYNEGDESNTMYIILEGMVRIYKKDSNGNEVNVAILKDGNFFGELALVDSKPRSATVVCLMPCKFLVIDQIAFMGLLLKSRSKVVFHVFSALASMVRDTTEKYFHEELAKEALHARIEIERHRLLAQMVMGVSHELNTPLGVIGTTVDFIKGRVTSEEILTLFSTPEAKAVLDDIVEATNLMQDNIAQATKLVQNFKKISVNELTAVKETINLVDAMTDIIDLFEINEREAHLKIDLRNNLSPINQDWFGYLSYLSQIMTHLFSNVAAYAYPKGQGGKVEVVMSADFLKKPVCYIIKVRDFGHGIPPENLSKVFEPFFTTGRIDGGTGLGLTVVYNLVTVALKGTVTIESELGQGTTVKIIFPQVIRD